MHTDQAHILLQYDEDTGAGGSHGNAEMTSNGGLNSSSFFGAHVVPVLCPREIVAAREIQNGKISANRAKEAEAAANEKVF